MKGVPKHSIGGRLYQWRRSRDLTQREAACLLKVPCRCYGKWERDEVEPGKCIQGRIAAQLGVELEEVTETSAEDAIG